MNNYTIREWPLNKPTLGPITLKPYSYAKKCALEIGCLFIRPPSSS
jgi:hypothetical protein